MTPAISRWPGCLGRWTTYDGTTLPLIAVAWRLYVRPPASAPLAAVGRGWRGWYSRQPGPCCLSVSPPPPSACATLSGCQRRRRLRQSRGQQHCAGKRLKPRRRGEGMGPVAPSDEIPPAPVPGVCRCAGRRACLHPALIARVASTNLRRRQSDHATAESAVTRSHTGQCDSSPTKERALS
jgi:hypothetical protein